jgi:hypothetical protein
MADAVSRTPLAMEARVRSLLSPCRICGGQSWHFDRFFPDYFGFPVSVLLDRCSTTWEDTKNDYHNHIRLHYRFAQETLRLRCVLNVCCGTLFYQKTTTVLVTCYTGAE